MMALIKRREFIAAFGGAAAAGAWPRAASAQTPALPVVGFLSAGAAQPYAHFVAAFRDGLSQSGYVENRNVLIEFKWAEGQYDRLPAMIADLISRRVDVISANALPVALAAKAATATIPIVFTSGADPVQFGLVASLNRPGGNITGVSIFFGALNAKRFELLRELVPSAPGVAVVVNPGNQNSEVNSTFIRTAAQSLNQPVQFFNARSESEIDAAFAAMVQIQSKALLVGDDPFFNARRAQFVALAARYAIPTIYYEREFVAAGGLISYGARQADAYRQAGVYVGAILKGAKPDDLPVLQPTKFELVINLKTAKSLGIEFPTKILALADEVIE